MSIFVRWLELKERALIDVCGKISTLPILSYTDFWMTQWKYRESHCCCARILLRTVGSSHFADAKLPSVIPIANDSDSCRSQSFSSKSYSSFSHAYLLQITKQEPSSCRSVRTGTTVGRLRFLPTPTRLVWSRGASAGVDILYLKDIRWSVPCPRVRRDVVHLS